MRKVICQRLSSHRSALATNSTSVLIDTHMKLRNICYYDKEGKSIYLPEPRPQNPCLCGSGRKSKSCCLKDSKTGYWFPPECITKTPDPKTGFSHKKCYARSLMDCCSKISREHYISESVLQVIGKKKDLLASGFPQQEPNVEELMSTNSLASKILCQRHNSALSPLDADAKRLVATLRAFDRRFGVLPSPKGFGNSVSLQSNEFELFNGHNIERWMLKTLCGFLASKNVRIKGKKIIEFQIKHSWLEILFGMQPSPNGCGLYVIPSTTYTYDSFGFTPLIFEKRINEAVDYTPIIKLEDRTNVYVHGAQLEITGFKFLLSVTGLMPDEYKPIKQYRPLKLVFTDGSSYKVIHFGWNDPSLKQVVTLEHTGRYSGRPPDQLGFASRS